MVKKLSALGMILVFMAVFIGVAIAEGKGNSRKGKYLFRKSCRTCHTDGAAAKDLSPVSKTQAEWVKTFEALDTLQCKEEWANLSEQDSLDIYSYLHGHAFDSPSPAKCK
ncbi:MAG: cytochrome c [Desulfobacterales bacterium]|nr:cytochrome c [Desulfobacterales bacterium]MBU8910738.1 cytochrome c [Desulfobacterales bacterium]